MRITALTEAGKRGPWSSAAEFTVLGRANPTLSRTNWTATALTASLGLWVGAFRGSDPS